MTTKKKTEPQENGVVPTAVEVPPLEFSPEELNLIHQILVQSSFPTWDLKLLAGQLQQKIEQFVSQ